MVSSLSQVQAVLVADQAQRAHRYTRQDRKVLPRTHRGANGTVDHVLVGSPTCSLVGATVMSAGSGSRSWPRGPGAGSQYHLDILTSALAEWFPNRWSELVLWAKMTLALTPRLSPTRIRGCSIITPVGTPPDLKERNGRSCGVG